MTGIVKTDQIQGAGSSTVTIPSGTALNVTTVSGTPTFSGDVTLPSINGGQIGGRRNIVINGAMQVAQRSTSVTGLGDGDEGYVTVDRVRHTAAASAGRFTSAQTAISDLSGFLNCLHLDCTTADTSISSGELLKLEYRMEGQDVKQLKKGTSDAEKITVSFYMKTNKAFTFMCELDDRDNNRVNTQQFTTSTSFTRHVLTFDGDTTGALDNDANASLSVGIYLHAGSDFTGGTYSANTWQSRASSDNMRAVGIGSFYDSTDNDVKITGLQVEVGSQATAFEHRSYGEELSLCQRYFHKQGGTAYYNIAVCVNYTSGAMLGTVRHPVQMRAAPSVTKSGTWAVLGGDTTVNQTAVSSDSGPQASEIGFSGGSGGTSGRSCVLRFSNDANAYLWWDAEL